MNMVTALLRATLAGIARFVVSLRRRLADEHDAAQERGEMTTKSIPDQIHAVIAEEIAEIVEEPDGFDRLRAIRWHQAGVALLRLDEIENDYVRQYLENDHAKRFGRRTKR